MVQGFCFGVYKEPITTVNTAIAPRAMQMPNSIGTQCFIMIGLSFHDTYDVLSYASLNGNECTNYYTDPSYCSLNKSSKRT